MITVLGVPLIDQPGLIAPGFTLLEGLPLKSVVCVDISLIYLKIVRFHDKKGYSEYRKNSFVFAICRCFRYWDTGNLHPFSLSGVALASRKSMTLTELCGRLDNITHGSFLGAQILQVTRCYLEYLKCLVGMNSFIHTWEGFNHGLNSAGDFPLLMT